ncbi:hypothetical protein Tco_0014428 [Tanacetum coccineum]
MDQKLEYQTFRAKPSESLSHTYTHYKTLLNELTNDGVTLSKHEINDFQEKSDDEADERSSEEYLRDLELEFHERALLENSKCFIKRKNKFSSQKANVDTKGFQSKFTPKLIQSSQHAQSSQGEPKFLKDYKAEYKKMKSKLVLLEASPTTYQPSKPFQSKNKGIVAETFDWDKEDVFDEEMNQVKVMALADDELSVGKNHARNGKWIDITIKKVNILLFVDEDSDWIRTSNSSTSIENLQRASPSSEIMTLTYQDHSPRERSGLGTMKYTKPKTQESLNKSVSGPVTISDNEPVTSSVPTKVKT